ncbi:DUF7503 family protein [Halorussus caseinilyticus]|uniref:Uncharacterized protein n=1 Tax=Halorussus caseinilyticus TaxID=3034025 RepID=A0ABD5WDY3_9EURY|nr:hypothetical protein [Halorussus sp. DT72]
MAKKSEVRDWLAENPKLMGALCTLLLLLAETGTVVATHTTGKGGP